MSAADIEIYKTYRIGGRQPVVIAKVTRTFNKRGPGIMLVEGYTLADWVIQQLFHIYMPTGESVGEHLKVKGPDRVSFRCRPSTSAVEVES